MSASDEAALELLRQLRLAGQLQHAWMSQAARLFQLHPASALLLSDLALHGECRLSDLAKRKMVDISVVSRQVGQLTAAGLVDRRPAPEDGRATLVRVSEHGHAELKRMRESYLDLFRAALSDWAEADVTALARTISSMNDALRDQLDAGGQAITTPPCAARSGA
ncbi:MarR family winged helix-turn-helix transcriptional regulator [Amycolatopsis taiwanensis]|uniref:MarR family transcriptional regulator n=1 Tax=Amycolatopsis taiwanensis TaxID=342230 RepID=A0A9W6VHI6_9PSEU|nr:MarR family winged helix-turn-helix transcriptional regulator [Amycolatopsis taiwanensis]GLY67314.1 MarR family transcriptional regulator [Amycolatopsis taiwanensis]